jgi:hypothetical protein
VVEIHVERAGVRFARLATPALVLDEERVAAVRGDAWRGAAVDVVAAGDAAVVGLEPTMSNVPSNLE